MKVSTENDNNFGNEKMTILVGNMPINQLVCENYRACDATAWMLKFVVIYLANTAVLCYSLPGATANFC
jgi:hypothetical protein